MRYLFIMLLIFTSLSFPLSSKEQNLTSFPFKERMMLAVMPFENKTKNKDFDHLKWSISSEIITELFGYSRFRLIERDKLKSILDELTIQQSNFFSQEFNQSIGQQLGAELMLLGNILDVSTRKKSKSLGIASIKEQIITLKIEARLVMISTGELIAVSKWSDSKSIKTKKALMASTQNGQNIDSILNELISRAAKKIAHELSSNALKKSNFQ